MKVKELSIRDKKVFNKFLSISRHELSVYAFENIYIWKGLFDIYWSEFKDSLCVFFKDKCGCFMYLPPLSKSRDPLVVKEAFEFMDGFNRNKDVSRIENITEADVPFYEKLGYASKDKSCDYICKRSGLASLSGKGLKHKRASFNYFIKHYEFQYLPFSLKHKDGCLELYDSWARQRRAHNEDDAYQYMLEDSRVSLKNALDNYSDLDFTGGIVKMDNKIKAFTFGFELNEETFCILYEITDLSIKGLAQFIFRRFCSELSGYKYINIMDDSGLENLKKVKFSYHPIKLVPAYIVTRKK